VSTARAPILLASASPRRRALLAATGLLFAIEPADVDESVEPGWSPEVAARRLAERKALCIAERHEEDAWVLGADTIVAVPRGDGSFRLLGKPEGPQEAAAMLRALSDTTHQVLTGLCVVRTHDGARFVDGERTDVRMRAITPSEIAVYVTSGEWRDKAGGYAIQESADRFVSGLFGGGFDNVIGLPVARCLALLRAAGAPLAGLREGR
jgi:septum formation protein